MTKERMFYLSKRTVGMITKTVIRVIQISVVLVLIVAGFGFWRLSVEPMNVDFLIPKIKANLLPENSTLNIETKSAILKTAFSQKGLLQIQIVDLVIMHEDGTVMTKLPEVDMIYGFGKLLTMNVVPDTLIIQKPTVQFVLDEQGKLMFLPKNGEALEPEEEVPVESVEKESLIVSEEAVQKIAGYFMSFDKIFIDDAIIAFDDRQKKKKISMPELDLLLDKEAWGKYVLKISGAVIADKVSANLNVDGVLNKRKQTMEYNVHFDSVNLASFSQINPMLSDIKLVVDGDVSVSLDLSKKATEWKDFVKKLSFQIRTEKGGNVSLPAPLTNVYPVKELFIQGAFNESMEKIEVRDSYGKLTTGIVAGISVDVEGIEAFLDTGDLDAIKTTLKAKVDGATVDMVPDVWPSALGPDAHAWVKQNLSGGVLDEALFVLYFRGAELVDLTGDIDVSGVTVDYLEPMPKAVNVGGKVYLYPDKVEIFANKGNVGKIELKKAALHLKDLNNVGDALIKISANGPINEAMDVIDSEPLGFAKMFEIDPKKTGGVGDVNLTIQFPFLEDLQMKDVKVLVEAKIADGVFPLPAEGQQVTGGIFDLKVDNNGLVLNGSGVVSGSRLNVTWEEYFMPKGDEKLNAFYHVDGVISDKVLKAFYQHAPGYVTGDISLNAEVKEYVGDKRDIQIAVDFTKALVKIYPISYEKEEGRALKAEIKFGMNQENMAYPMVFNVQGDKDVVMKGSVDLSREMDINIEQIRTSKNDFKGRVQKDAKGNLDLMLVGKKLNMSHWDEMPEVKVANAAEVDDKINIPNTMAVPPDISLNVELDEFYMTEDKPLKQISIQGVRKGAAWKNLFASAMGSKPFSLKFSPENASGLYGESNDFGDLVMRLGMSSSLQGGELRINASQQRAGGFKGNMIIKDFNVKDVGFLTQALTVLGIVDAIRGKELNFKKATVPFELSPYQTLFITDGQAHGTNLGITFAGRISFDDVSLSGSVIPAYALNSLPGKIPLVGDLFKDSVGGGLMGVKYDITGSIGNTKTDFHALSSLAPGILGKLFQ